MRRQAHKPEPVSMSPYHVMDRLGDQLVAWFHYPFPRQHTDGRMTMFIDHKPYRNGRNKLNLPGSVISNSSDAPPGFPFLCL